MADYDFDEKSSSSSSNKIPLFTVIARVVTLGCLLISSLVVNNNEVSGDYNGYVAKYNYQSFDTYRFVFGVMITGLCYTVVQIPFAGYYLVAKKQLIDHQLFRLSQFIGDKIIFGLLSTAAGASLAATVELQNASFPGGLGAKMHAFLALMHVPNAFLVVSLVSSLISSGLSSLNLHNSE